MFLFETSLGTYATSVSNETSNQQYTVFSVDKFFGVSNTNFPLLCTSDAFSSDNKFACFNYLTIGGMFLL